jgi:flagellar M-ring protein FliF
MNFIKALPVAHRVAIAAALAVVVMLAVPFVTWITTPTYTVLYSGLDDVAVAGAVDALESQGVPYRLEAGGSRVLVPREQLYATRAALASEGVGGRTTPAGYELLDEQGLSVSDFRQRVDYRRALEGELARTLSAMDGIREATVHLVTPERELFTERQEPVTASVLLATVRTLSQTEVEAVTFLVASSVEGLETGQITVADASGAVLHAPGDSGGSPGGGSRNLRQTREYEQTVAADIAALLERVTGSPASVVVRATLDYDESETETETFDPESQVAVREQTSQERFEGTGVIPGGTVGVDGGPLEADAEESTYEKEETLREFGVDRVTSRTVAAPGRVERLSVAIVADDGTLTGADVPPDAVLSELVSTAVGLVPERGDAIAVTTLAFPARVEAETVEPEGSLLDQLPQMIGAVVLLVVCLLLVAMTRRRKVTVESVERTPPALAELHAEGDRAELREPEPAMVGSTLRSEVVDLVERQPEEIATLLRGWLADRRGL